jgi:hypothetical protein
MGRNVESEKRDDAWEAAEATQPSVSLSHQDFKESHSRITRDELLNRRIADLNLRLEGTRIARLTSSLYDELAKAGLVFRPAVYFSDEWGCPDRVPIIGVPFYLADTELMRLEEEFMEGIETESDDQIMRYLRHEAGHAFNYAYRLYERADWTALFGPFVRPYTDEYTPNPFSRSFVRHLPGWYAQKHPDEDFAETFAVWLDPKSNWREAYANWKCLSKLLYVDELAHTIGAEPSPVTAENYDTREQYLSSTIAEHYKGLAPAPVEIPRLFDGALQDIFQSPGTDLDSGVPAAEFLKRHRRRIVWSVFHWTGLNYDLVRGLVMHLEERSSELRLQVGRDESGILIQIVALVTTLCMNRLATGDFVHK